MANAAAPLYGTGTGIAAFSFVAVATKSSGTAGCSIASLKSSFYSITLSFVDDGSDVVGLGDQSATNFYYPYSAPEAVSNARTTATGAIL